MPPDGGVDVGADDDAVRLDAAEHGFLRVLGKVLDGDAKVVCGALAAVSHALRCSGAGALFGGWSGFWGEMLHAEVGRAA